MKFQGMKCLGCDVVIKSKDNYRLKARKINDFRDFVIM